MQTVTLPKPPVPTGYSVYNIDAQPIHKYSHLHELRKSLSGHGYFPKDVLVYRLSKSENKEVMRLMFISEYAFRIKTCQNFGSHTIESEEWDWYPQYGTLDKQGNIGYELNSFTKFSYFKFKFKYFLSKFSNFFQSL